MKRKLMKLDEVLLRRIAKDFSIYGPTKEDVATSLAQYLRVYTLTWEDLLARYGQVLLGGVA